MPQPPEVSLTAAGWTGVTVMAARVTVIAGSSCGSLLKARDPALSAELAVGEWEKMYTIHGSWMNEPTMPRHHAAHLPKSEALAVAVTQY